mgnify:CR=1 FL=1
MTKLKSKTKTNSTPNIKTIKSMLSVDRAVAEFRRGRLLIIKHETDAPIIGLAAETINDHNLHQITFLNKT